MKLHPAGAKLFLRMEGRIDMMKLVVTFHNFVNVPKD